MTRHTAKWLLAIALYAIPALVVAEGTADDRLPNDPLRELEREADELSEQAMRTVEDFIKLLEPMLDRLSIFIDDLPSYHAPEVQPNGDIIIRRKHEGGPDPIVKPAPDGATDT